jgi:hypothetical protein
MNVEDVVLAGDVADRPFLDVADLRHRVIPIRRPLLAVDEERVAVCGFREGGSSGATV